MKKLLFVVGAGASIDFGMPTVRGVGQLINNNNQVQAYYPLAENPNTNLFNYIEGLVSQHLGREAQFEDVLYAIFWSSRSLCTSVWFCARSFD